MNQTCLLCGSNDWQWLVTGFDRLQATDADYEYCRCKRCGLVSLQTPVACDAIGNLYPPDYPPHQPSGNGIPKSRVTRLAIRHYYSPESSTGSRLLRSIFKLLSSRIMRDVCEPRGPCRLLDLGCGSGDLMARHQALGWEVFGIDHDARACAACRARGLAVHEGTIFDAPQGEKFDVVLISHLIEHVRDPVIVLRAAAKFLADQGRIVLRTPNIQSAAFKLYGSCWFALDAPRHVHLFTPHTIRRLAERAGLVVCRLKTYFDPMIYCNSRHYSLTQGRRLPRPIEERKVLLSASNRHHKKHRVFRQLTFPLASLSLLGKGDLLEVELERAENRVAKSVKPPNAMRLRRHGKIHREGAKARKENCSSFFRAFAPWR
ncbi:MAG TPA: class I SAM-dependent methyltransferase [Acidobacteriota bacterium]